MARFIWDRTNCNGLADEEDCDTVQQALRAANADWNHLTDREKRACSVFQVIDEDNHCVKDFMEEVR